MNRLRSWYSVSYALVVGVLLVAAVVLRRYEAFGDVANSAVAVSTVDLATLKPTGNPTEAEKEAVFDRVWTLFDTNYPDFQEKMIDWDSEKVFPTCPTIYSSRFSRI
ncbi:hypothetical protein [Alicyclobacillus dauci]|uniref:Uncharacterized protein n=1 Tax=Alicyclobacillus dauci TaxID=1475485 RepID=A0ABY6Z4K0_9BACL|nr:hypothetical protein [Alicyclobacillus dauci]WAH37812.1 hypothetical protein NZD86_04720 [Alicyclobacillus dauci]